MKDERDSNLMITTTMNNFLKKNPYSCFFFFPLEIITLKPHFNLNDSFPVYDHLSFNADFTSHY